MTALVAFLLLGPEVSRADCISASERADLLRKIKMATVQIDVNEEEGSGFVLNSDRGAELITAHHVIDDQRGAGEGCGGAAGHSVGLRVPTVHFTKGQPLKKARPNFSTAEVDHIADLAKVKLDARRYRALTAESSDRLPNLGEEILIAGHPGAKNEKYTQHSCRFIGYGDSLNSVSNPTYSLRCDGVDYDLAGMSGGVAISACTGRVIGALSSQDTSACHKRGDKTYVSIAPLHAQHGEIRFGLPKASGPTQCWYELQGRTDLRRDCLVEPGRFPSRTPSLSLPTLGSDVQH